MLELNHQTFDEVLAGEKPVLVDFWAEWCGPCRAVAPVVEGLAREFDGQVTVAKLDVDANAEIAARYDVRAIPTFLLFRDGHVVGRLLGAVPRAKLEAAIRKTLADEGGLDAGHA